MDLLQLLPLIGIAVLASTLSSVAGFGGSLLVLPVLVHTAGPLVAIPAFTIAGMMSNAARSLLGRSLISWSVVRAFLVGAIPGAVLGSFVFVSIPAEWMQRSLAAFIVAMMFTGHRSAPRRWPFGLIAAAGGGSAFLSGVFGFSGPISAAIFFAQGLSPAAYVASEATAAMVVHAVKIVAYDRLSALTPEALWLGLIVGGAMTVGAWLGRRWIDRIPPDRYRSFIRAVFVVTAASLLIV